jgi:hypothetical protein
MRRRTTRVTTLALAVLAGVVATGALGASGPIGIGRMMVLPNIVIAGSAGNELTFTFLADSSSLRGQTIVDVPRGWTAPQRANPSAPGFVEVKPGGCDPSTRIVALRVRRLTIATSCGRRRSYQLLYHNATAPTITSDGYIFLAQTRSRAAGRKAKYRPLGRRKQPIVKVRGGPAAGLYVGAPGVVVAGTAFGLTVRAIDAYGNNAYPYLAAVSFASSDPAATLSGPYTFVPTDAAQHVFEGTVLRTPGTQVITVTDPNGLTGRSASITVVPG